MIFRLDLIAGGGPSKGDMRLMTLSQWLLVVISMIAVAINAGVGAAETDDKSAEPLLSTTDTLSPTSRSMTTENGTNPMSAFHGRFLSVMGRMQPNQEYQVCQTPAGEKGHCKYPQHCNLPEVKTSVWKVLGYLCLIQTLGIGVCCPDESNGKVVNGPQSGLDNDDDPPVWSAAESNRIDDQPSPALPRPEERGCGLATKSFPRITGGRPADPGEWPWMAALLRRGLTGPFCGGVLVTDRHVLTAAHCTHRYRTNEIFVRLGEYNFTDFNETRARDFRVLDIRQHQDFDENTYEHDIALLKLDRATMFNSYIWPVCMPPQGESWEGYRAVVTGWGTQFFGGPTSEVLMEVSMPVWTQKQCKDAFNERITTSVLCAGAFEGGRDSCQGDSGGPLLAQLPNRRWITIGIVSWGIRCGEPNYPGIYTRVDAYADWIVENAVF